jgi:excisionase family DNA binding protein
LLETDHAWVNRFVEEGRLKALVRDAGKKRVFLIDLHSLKELKCELDQFLSTKEVCRRLGVGRDRLMTLVRSGRLPPERGPSVDGFAEWKFTRPSVDELV